MHEQRRKWFTPACWHLLAVVALVASSPGCTVINPVRKPYVPHPRQRAWVNEAAVINLVTRLVYDARFESRQEVTEMRYATVLRYWYKRCSVDGEDLDGGLRALNYIRKIHFDAGGDRKLWKRVAERAREAAPGEDGLPIPSVFE